MDTVLQLGDAAWYSDTLPLQNPTCPAQGNVDALLQLGNAAWLKTLKP